MQRAKETKKKEEERKQKFEKNEAIVLDHLRKN